MRSRPMACMGAARNRIVPLPVPDNNNNIVYELEIGKPLLGDLCNTDQTPSELQVAERG